LADHRHRDARACQRRRIIAYGADASPGLRVIYLTAYDILGVDDGGVGPLLRKPIDDEHLIATHSAEGSTRDGMARFLQIKTPFR
jgi:hypothetical protein